MPENLRNLHKGVRVEVATEELQPALTMKEKKEWLRFQIGWWLQSPQHCLVTLSNISDIKSGIIWVRDPREKGDQ